MAREARSSGLDLGRIVTGLNYVETTYAWGEIERAIQRLDEDSYESEEKKADDAYTVQGFADILQRRGNFLAKALLCAEAISFADRGANRSAAVERGLQAISKLNGFDALDAPRKEAIIDDLLKRVKERFPALEERTSRVRGLELLPGELAAWEDVLDVERTGLEIPEKRLKEDCVQAWSQRRSQIESFLAGEPTDPARATLEEHLCFVANRLPSSLVDRNLENMTLRAWSEVLVQILIEEPVGHAPTWARAAALAALNLGRDLPMEQLVRRIELAEPPPSAKTGVTAWLLVGPKPLNDAWKPSRRHGAIVLKDERTAMELVKSLASGGRWRELQEWLAPDVLVAEVDLRSLENQVTSAEVVGAQIASSFEQFGPTAVVLASSVRLDRSVKHRAIVKPRDLDDLLDRASGSSSA